MAWAALSLAGPSPTAAKARAIASGSFTIFTNFTNFTNFIGRGMDEVYECQDVQLERKVAVKLVRGPGGEQHQEALTREAKAMAKLAHPNVVTVFEVGSCGTRTFIVMEYSV